MVLKSVLFGILGALTLLTLYFTLVSFISGWSFTLSQFSSFWYFIVSLAAGFGIQVGLYTYLKNIIHPHDASGAVLSVSGSTSGVAMLSCCAHYLVNILPLLGTVGIISLISQYQVQLFWVGLIFNLIGIAYIGNKVIKIRQIRK